MSPLFRIKLIPKGQNDKVQLGVVIHRVNYKLFYYAAFPRKICLHCSHKSNTWGLNDIVQPGVVIHRVNYKLFYFAAFPRKTCLHCSNKSNTLGSNDEVQLGVVIHRVIHVTQYGTKQTYIYGHCVESVTGR